MFRFTPEPIRVIKTWPLQVDPPMRLCGGRVSEPRSHLVHDGIRGVVSVPVTGAGAIVPLVGVNAGFRVVVKAITAVRGHHVVLVDNTVSHLTVIIHLEALY